MIKISEDVFGDVGKMVACIADGNGMIGAGICDGDYILFDTECTPQSGDVVMVEVNGITCCRRYFKEGVSSRFRREDGIANDVITTDYTIRGVMVGLIRKFGRAG